MNKIIAIVGTDQTGNEKLARRIQKCNPDFLRKAVFATNRPIKKGEIHADHFYFLDERTFGEKKNAGDFIFVYKCKYSGYRYGLLSEEIRRFLIRTNVIVVTNTRGFYDLRSQYEEGGIVSIFIETQEYKKPEQLKCNLCIKPVLDRTRFNKIQRFLEQKEFVPAKRVSIK